MEHNKESIIFCRKCGNKLLDDSLFCEKCGTNVIVADNIDSDVENESIDVQEPTSQKNKNYLKKILLFSILSVVLIGVIAFTGFWIFKTRVVKQDINTINGCPEFYDLNWEMSQYEVDESVELKHTFYAAFPKFDSSTFETIYENDAMLYPDEGEVFYLYGKRTKDFYVDFDKECITGVLLVFSRDKYSLDDIVSLYEKIYGTATVTNTKTASWIGKDTTIRVYEYTSDDDEEEIVVFYSITENRQYKALTFDGPELDPCDFLGENSAFDKTPEYYIDGLKEDEDFFKFTYESEFDGFQGFNEYALLPEFEYMGLAKGQTAIEFSKDIEEDYISLVSYSFLLYEDNVVDRMKYIYSKLLDKYGYPTDSTYTSTYYDKLGYVDLSFDEMVEKFSSGTEGLYHIQWKHNGITITLGLTISVDKEYYEGEVAYAN